MEIDNWQTMILIFEVVCRIFKKQGGKYGAVTIMLKIRYIMGY